MAFTTASLSCVRINWNASKVNQRLLSTETDFDRLCSVSEGFDLKAV